MDRLWRAMAILENLWRPDCSTTPLCTMDFSYEFILRGKYLFLHSLSQMWYTRLHCRSWELTWNLCAQWMLAFDFPLVCFPFPSPGSWLNGCLTIFPAQMVTKVTHQNPKYCHLKSMQTTEQNRWAIMFCSTAILLNCLSITKCLSEFICMWRTQNMTHSRKVNKTIMCQFSCCRNSSSLLWYFSVLHSEHPKSCLMRMRPCNSCT